MNTEQKTKAYDKALERAKNIYGASECKDILCTLETIFPELKESEDERILEIIKHCIESRYLHTSTIKGISQKECFAWLEKQGEQKPADKVEPKFHKGDWIVHHGTENIYQVVAIIDNQYQLKYGDTYTIQNSTDVDRCTRLYDIAKDAKDGDVLVASDESLFIFAKVKDNAAYYHFSLCKNGSKEISDGKHAWETVKGCHPATKEQRDTLFAKMKEAGYTWNADKKQLKKIEQKPAEEYSFNIESELFHQLTKEQQELWKKEIEQAYNAGVEASDEWSEEDEKYIKDLTDYFIGGMSLKHTEENIIAWIKSLGHQQKQEWSEEDEEYLRRAINTVKNTYPMTANWLKSLKERYTWKPSDAQMGALHDLNLTGNISYAGQGQVLIELYNDLKKLTE